jgi:cytochrome c oxidase assembly factor CtaG
LTAILFAIGWLRLRNRSAAGKAGLDQRAFLYTSGWFVLAAALVSPLHQLGERSFAAHMFEHELLMLAAAPLFVLARPMPIVLWTFSSGARRTLGQLAASGPLLRFWRYTTSPVVATLLQAAVLWLWHAPALFDRALASEGWHAAQHVSFLVVGLFFWSAMLARTTTPGVAVLCLFATSLVSGALGALMAFAASPWYARYAELGLAPFDLTPTEDQQLAGLLMWIPGGMIHALVALILFNGMLRQDGRGAHVS